MLNPDRRVPGDWYPDPVPENVVLGEGAYIESACCFKRLRSRHPRAVVLGAHASVYAACHFNLAPDATCEVGDYTLLNGAAVLAERSIRIGSHCLVSWNVVLADSDFHPLDPALRRLDTIALAPGGDPSRRPPVLASPVVIEDDVWIGFNACVLKGVRVGRGAVIGAGTVVTRDVPPLAVVAGNPARIVKMLEAAATAEERAAALAGPPLGDAR